jgi:hypothetical protein
MDYKIFCLRRWPVVTMRGSILLEDLVIKALVMTDGLQIFAGVRRAPGFWDRVQSQYTYPDSAIEMIVHRLAEFIIKGLFVLFENDAAVLSEEDIKILRLALRAYKRFVESKEKEVTQLIGEEWSVVRKRLRIR